MGSDAAFWNGIAEKYSRSPVANPGAFERKIEITKSRMKPSDTVLDIGCGTGSLALRLAPFAAHVHGLDVSSEMVRIANGKAAADGVHDVTFHEGPFDDAVPFAPASVDVLCAYSILHLVDDLPAALQRIHRLVKPGGSFVSSTACLRDSWVPFGPLVWAMRLVGKAPKVVQLLSAAALKDAMAAAGFVDIEAPDVGAKKMVAFFVARKPS
ncbi:MAG TPA: class I SAM-dependent methyltransferase [Nannocystaceae bacterium]|nr:class I SAM-dependent methyltransferase [Nannocystaceae bacterium]